MTKKIFTKNEINKLKQEEKYLYSEDSSRKRINRMIKKFINSGFLIQILKKNENIKEKVREFEKNLDNVIYDKKMEVGQFYTSFEKQDAINEIRQKLLEWYDIRLFKKRNLSKLILCKKNNKKDFKNCQSYRQWISNYEMRADYIVDFKSLREHKDKLIKKYKLKNYEIEENIIKNLTHYLDYIKDVNKSQTSQTILYSRLIDSLSSGKKILEQDIKNIKNFYLKNASKLHENKIDSKYLTLSFNKEFRDQIFLSLNNFFKVSIGSKCNFSEKEKIGESYILYLKEYINKLNAKEILEKELIKNNVNSLFEVEELFLFFLENKITKFAIESDLDYMCVANEFIDNNNIIKKFNRLKKLKQEDFEIFYFSYQELYKILKSLNFKNINQLQENLSKLKREYVIKFYCFQKKEEILSSLSCKNIEQFESRKIKIEEFILCLKKLEIYFGFQELKALFFIISLKENIFPYKKTIENLFLDIKKYQEKEIISEITNDEKNIYLRKIGIIRELVLLLSDREQKIDDYKICRDIKKNIFEVIDEIEKILYPETINRLLENFYFESIEFLEKEYIKIKKK